MAPPSQKLRTIGFVLDGGSGNTPVRFTFAIRPEDLARHEPSRSSVQQTLGGAWLDSFGPGVSAISLTGHNGWRGGTSASGEEMFRQLRDTVFVQWHARREQQAARGADPDEVTLTFADALDQITVTVAPRVFTLQRSKSSPLLMRYRIELDVLGDAGAGTASTDPITAAMSNPARSQAALDSMDNSISGLQTLQQTLPASPALQSVFGAGSPALPFLGTSVGVASAMQTAFASAKGLLNAELGPILAIGAPIVTAARTAFQVEAQAIGLIQQAKSQVGAIARGFNDVVCSLQSFNFGRTFTSFDDLFGASGCSSTGGGHPWNPYTITGANPFLDLFTQGTGGGGGISATPAAAAAMATLQGDPFDLAKDPVLVRASMATIASGVQVQ